MPCSPGGMSLTRPKQECAERNPGLDRLAAQRQAPVLFDFRKVLHHRPRNASVTGHCWVTKCNAVLCLKLRCRSRPPARLPDTIARSDTPDSSLRRPHAPAPSPIDDSAILGVVDVQPTFMPGGELPVADGAAVVPVINRLLAGRFPLPSPPRTGIRRGTCPSPPPIPAARRRDDALPRRQVLWPDHALPGSANAALHPGSISAGSTAIIRKGTDPAIDSYSAFFENDRNADRARRLARRARRPPRVPGRPRHGFLRRLVGRGRPAPGLCGDVIADACRAIALPTPGGGTTLDTARAEMAAAGIRFLHSNDLRA